MHPLYINFSQPILFTVLKQQHSIFFKKTEPKICLTHPLYFVGVDLFNECIIYTHEAMSIFKINSTSEICVIYKFNTRTVKVPSP